MNCFPKKRCLKLGILRHLKRRCVTLKSLFGQNVVDFLRCESGLDASIISYDEVVYIICVEYVHNHPKLVNYS